MRSFPYITVGKILQELKEDGFPLARVTFYRLESALKLPKPTKETGEAKWRVYSREQAEEVKNRIRKEYNLPVSTKFSHV